MGDVVSLLRRLRSGGLDEASVGRETAEREFTLEDFSTAPQRKNGPLDPSSTSAREEANKART